VAGVPEGADMDVVRLAFMYDSDQIWPPLGTPPVDSQTAGGGRPVSLRPSSADGTPPVPLTQPRTDLQRNSN
jgi:hypothetical protein